MATTAYEKDVILWSQQQAALLRSGEFSQLDIEHLADEIEDVGKSEKRELANRMAKLLAHLLKWQYQPERRGRSWQTTIRNQRNSLKIALKITPSLKAAMREKDWQTLVWADAVDQALKETGLDADFGEACPWTNEQILSAGWLPEA